MNIGITKSRRIHLAYGDPEACKVTKAILSSLHHTVPLITNSGKELIEESVSKPADLIISTPSLSDMDGIDALIRIGEQKPTAAMIIARSDDLEKVERAMEDHVMAYLVEPVTAEAIQPSIILAERRFQYFQSLSRQIMQLEEKLEARKVIEKAKGIVMQSRDLGEQEAHRLLQTIAKQQREKLVDVSRKICEAGSLLPF